MIVCCLTLGKCLVSGICNEWAGVLGFGGWLMHYN